MAHNPSTTLTPRFYLYGVNSTALLTGTAIIDPVVGSTAATTTWVVGHPTAGKIGTFSIPTDTASANAVDITSYVVNAEIETCSQGSALDGWGGGKMTLVLDSNDRRFDPLCTYGPYTPSGATENLFSTGRLIRCGLYSSIYNRVTHWLFSGFVGAIQPAMIGPTLATYRTVVGCVDAFDVWGRYNGRAAVSVVGDGDNLGKRLRRIGAMAGWGRPTRTTTTFRDPFYGYCVASDSAASLDGTYLFASSTMAQNALTLAKQASFSEDSHVLVGRSGEILWTTSTVRSVPHYHPNAPGDQVVNANAYQVGYSASMPASFNYLENIILPGPAVSTQIDWTVQGAAIPTLPDQLYAHDLDDVATVARGAVAGGDAIEYGDPVAIQKRGLVVWERTDMINSSETDLRAILAARVARHKDQTSRLQAFKIYPYLDSHAMYMAATANPTMPLTFVAKVGDGTGTVISQTAYITKMKHILSGPSRWEMEITTSGVI